MKRYYCMLLAFSVCLIAVGCRRSGEQRPPTSTEFETDILPAMNEKEILFSSRPKDRKSKVWIENVYEVDRDLKGKDKSVRKKRWTDIADAQDKMEKNKDLSKEVQALEANAGAIEAEQEFLRFAAASFEFLKLKKANPKDFSPAEFYKFARRGGLFFNRKYLDKAEMEIFEEEVRLIKFIDKGAISFVPDVDMNNPKKDYIIAHRPGGGGGGMMGGASTFPSLVMYNREEKGYEKMPAGTLSDTLQVQDLRVLHLYYVRFAGPHFVRAPADARENGLLPSYDTFIKTLAYGDPSATLRNVDARVASVMKNPPEPRELDKFKKYLKDNAPPNLLAKINSGTHAVNMAANLRSPGDIVACRAYSEMAKDINNKEFPVGHWAILTNGTWRYAQAAEIAPFLVAPPPPEKKDMMMMPK